MTSKLLQANNLIKNYGAQFTLQVPSLEVVAGETVCLLGPTGAGKSTLLRLLAGVEPVTSGSISFDDQPLSCGTMRIELQRRITLVFQQPQLLTGSVRSNVRYGARLRGASGEALRRAEATLDRFGLAAIAKQRTSTLSGGQRQLVAIARALAIEPSLLLLDEPTANLDPANVVLVEKTIREVQQEHGMTVVWSTHNLFQARRVSCRTVFVLNGELIEVAPTRKFFEAPSDSRTTDFVQGKMVY